MRSIACPVAHVRAPLISSRGSQAHRYMIRVEGMSKAEGVRKHGRGDECPVIQEGYQPPFGDKISMDTRDIRVVSLTTGEKLVQAPADIAVKSSRTNTIATATQTARLTTIRRKIMPIAGNGTLRIPGSLPWELSALFRRLSFSDNGLLSPRASSPCGVSAGMREAMAGFGDVLQNNCH
jgi:hypothetical protein